MLALLCHTLVGAGMGWRPGGRRPPLPADRTLSDLPTSRDYAGVHRVDVVCVACDHWARLDLDDLFRLGQGDVALNPARRDRRK